MFIILNVHWCSKAVRKRKAVTTNSFVKAKCRPTMRTNPPFYKAFVCLAYDTTGGNISNKEANCMCPAGQSQSCVHVAALLLDLVEVTQTTCTSVPCAWSRSSTRGQPLQITQLNFDKASVERYKPYMVVGQI